MKQISTPSTEDGTFVRSVEWLEKIATDCLADLDKFCVQQLIVDDANHEGVRGGHHYGCGYFQDEPGWYTPNAEVSRGGRQRQPYANQTYNQP